MDGSMKVLVLDVGGTHVDGFRFDLAAVLDRGESGQLRQVKNFLTVTMLAVGMPMLLMGDEVR
jgi:pullulanase/glycogen debranching enzyme